MTDNISVNALKPRLGQPGSENPNLIIPPSAGPTGRSKNKNSEGKPLTCSDEDEGCVGSKHCRVGKLKHWCKTEEQKCIFLLSCDEVTINAVKICSHLQRRKYPTECPVWTSATQSHGGSELEERTEQALRHAATSTQTLLEHTLYYLLHTLLLPINTKVRGKKLSKKHSKSWLLCLTCALLQRYCLSGDTIVQKKTAGLPAL